MHLSCVYSITLKCGSISNINKNKILINDIIVLGFFKLIGGVIIIKHTNAAHISKSLYNLLFAIIFIYSSYFKICLYSPCPKWYIGFVRSFFQGSCGSFPNTEFKRCTSSSIEVSPLPNFLFMRNIFYLPFSFGGLHRKSTRYTSCNPPCSNTICCAPGNSKSLFKSFWCNCKTR